MGQIGLFDGENILRELSKLGDPLEKLDAKINWKLFKPIIDKAFRKERKSNAGRPPFDYTMMFKILVLQHLYSLSDHQTQFQISDRYSFRRFLGFSAESTIPDENTVWNFREALTNANAFKKCFELFDRFLNEAGFTAKKGMILDATFMEVPRQRNSREENEQIKNDQTPDKWKENESKLNQKDVDARWTQKNDENHYGYKDHINVDAKHKIIRKYVVTSAEVHDSQVVEDILDPMNEDQSVYADSAYRSKEIDEKLEKLQYRNRVHERPYRNTPLTEYQIKENKIKSKIRARVEHVFGYFSTKMKITKLRSIGLRRNAGRIGLINLIYNMNRYVLLAK